MGNGIAHVFAMNGFQVQLIDINETALEKGLTTIKKNLERMVQKGTISAELAELTVQNLTPTTSFEAVSNVDLVVEAATENTQVKLELFKKIDALTSDKCILASNTSSISITKIASVCSKPQNVIGMHFMNPVPVMKLVEIINGYKTSAEVSNSIVELSKILGKVPTVVNDYPGFVANRILMPMINEAIETLYEGVAGVEEIDTVMKLGMAHPMGPLQLADFIGLDVCLAILKVLHEGFGNPKYAPNPLLINMVTAGELGVKTGQGFYQYEKGSKDLKVSEKFSSKNIGI